ncbi:cellulase family glycosylhydrolase [Agrobacterium vitis]|uniref:Cellulase family glycosylhydrolase n=2 Tax=Agrobacterium vitis TaxID=373 RepID=A0A6L6VI94_AGRVI|nr:cellulase family glycosylhydrolase [Agrobacterium vitis]
MAAMTTDRCEGVLKRTIIMSVALTLSVAPVISGQASAGQACMRGVNLSGAEFGEIGGAPDRAYTYPSAKTINYFAEKGFNSVRLPFKWERLQPKLNSAFDADELKRLDTAVAQLKEADIRVVLDPHNFAVYHQKQINGPDVPVEAFADLWMRLAAHYANDQTIVFGLMNEPYDMPASQWLPAANAAIAAIRQVGAKNLILVPGVSWTGAHSWQSDGYGGANGEVMLGVKDPGNNYAYEVHQYFDADFSGTKDECSRAGDAVAAIETFTDWLRKNDKRGYLGEFGAPGAEPCVKGIKDMVAVVEKNPDRWVGWAYWVAGDWWPETEMLNIQPGKSGDRPQLAGLTPYLRDFSAASADCPSLRSR